MSMHHPLTLPDTTEFRRKHIHWKWWYEQYELQCGIWKQNLDPLQKQQVILSTETSFELQNLWYLKPSGLYIS